MSSRSADTGSNQQAPVYPLPIPSGYKRLLILGMDAHMDWDWVFPFQELVSGSPYWYATNATGIISQAFDLIKNNANHVGVDGQPEPYIYNICEMGFLQGAVETKPSLVAEFQQYVGDKLGIEGGGMTSPDNLLPHGEAFFRNYLVGKQWQQSVFGLPMSYVYIPDDFGHDAQLPVMVEAMGLSGVSFSRIPGSQASSSDQTLSGAPTLAEQLWSSAVDFVWQASDGSTAVAHWMQETYCQGNSLKNSCTNGGVNASGAIATLNNILFGTGGADPGNAKAAPTPYIYIPCGCDFAEPIPCLLAIADAWNQQQASSTGIYAVAGKLGDYLKSIAAYPGGSGFNTLKTQTFMPTPYWTGFYASRPANKILHHASVNAILGAEVYSQIGSSLQQNDYLAWKPVLEAQQQGIDKAWEGLCPSTHHDYITGTAVDSVYTEEQQPLLAGTLSLATGLRRAAIDSIAPLIEASPNDGEAPFAVFNQLGFDRAGLAEITAAPDQPDVSVRDSANTLAPIQKSAEGNLLFLVTAPSQGYQTYYLSSQQAPPIPSSEAATLQFYTTFSKAILGNGLISVTIDKPSAYSITAINQIVNGNPGQNLVPQGELANDLVFYEDQGDIYCFGNEYDTTHGGSYMNKISTANGVLVGGDIELLEKGPLRVRVRTTALFSKNGYTATYVREYSIVAGEPFVRISCTGSVPLPPSSQRNSTMTPYSVMVRFPFALPGSVGPVGVEKIVRGTPYHWEDENPVPYWKPPTFTATHHFAVAESTVGGNPYYLGALYHRDIPAWAIDASSNGALVGCILRNTPGGFSPAGHGANGVDYGTHTHHYAFRVPDQNIKPASSTQLFQESMSSQIPLQTALVNVPMAGISPNFPVSISNPTSISLAAVASGTAILTVAKAGTFDTNALILRLYQPTNGSQSVSVDISGYMSALNLSDSQVKVEQITALEEPVGTGSIPVSGGKFTLQMQRAVATMSVKKI